MSVKEAKNELIHAEKSLESANVLHAAKASLTLLKVNVESHRAVRRLFSQHLIKTGKIAGEYAKILGAEQDERLKADYDVLYSPDEENARECATDARESLSAIKKYLKEQDINLDIQEKS